MKTVILSDLHGRSRATIDLFQKIGLMDSDGGRVNGFHVIQLGDALSLGYGELEANFYKMIHPFIDEWIIGNHEYPAFNPSSMIRFSGWGRRDHEATKLVRDNADKYKASTSVGRWLITHAGLHPSFFNGVHAGDTLAVDVSKLINAEYETHRDSDFLGWNGLFDSISMMRGGYNAYGGIFWNDIDDLVEDYDDNNNLIPQICGHSSYAKTGLYAHNLWCIDTRESAAALITDDGAVSWQLVVSDVNEPIGGRSPVIE